MPQLDPRFGFCPLCRQRFKLDFGTKIPLHRPPGEVYPSPNFCGGTGETISKPLPEEEQKVSKKRGIT